MDDLVVSLIVVAVTGVLVAGLFIYLNARKKQQTARLEQAAREFGWQVQPIRKPLSSGYLFQGKFPGVSWSMESRADASGREAGPGSSEVSHTTRWWTSAVSLPGSGVIIGLRPAGAPALSHPILQLGLKAMLGQDAAWASSLTPIEHGTRALQNKYITLAEKEADLQRLLAPEVENVLMALPEKIKPVIKLKPDGLEIVLNGVQVTEPSELRAVVSLGKALVNAWGG